MSDRSGAPPPDPPSRRGAAPRLWREGSVRLRDGRRLAYVEAGDPQGAPVVFLHGNPGSRHMRHPDDALTRSLGVRLITPDRPGYGFSDYQPNRTLLDLPADVEQLADALAVGRFAVFGVSAGGPYVAACAYRLGARLTRAAIVSGAAPFDRPGALDGINADFRRAWAVAALPEWLMHPLLAWHDAEVRARPYRALAAFLAHASPDDRAVLRDPAVQAQVLNYRAEATRQGVQGVRREAHLLARPWGFRLEAIEAETHLWYWDGDSIAPPQMGRFLQARLRRAVPHFLPRGGHFSLFSHWREILTALTAP
ncbi:MAG TPA: alpha/beta hydrolase [Polyangiaceae bacterium]|nr:alpha/beta hydrolase [Polyangiaceae bacterium]